MLWILVLAGILLSVPSQAKPIQVSLLVDEPEGDIAASLVASPITSRSGAEIPEAVTIQAEAPGFVQVDLAQETSWRLEVKAPGFWAPDVLLTVNEAPREVSVRLVPTVVLRALVEIPAGSDAPTHLNVRFRSPGRRPDGRRAVDDSVDCPVLQGTWRCDVPVGKFDLRLRARGFVSHYFWEREFGPRSTLSLGTLQLVPGASISGWLVTDDDSPLQPGVRVVASPQIHQVVGPRAAARHRSLEVSAPVSDRGFFQLEGLPPGAYVLEAKQEGFVPYSSLPVVLAENSETELDEPLMLSRPSELLVSVDPAVDAKGDAWTLTLVSPADTEPVGVGRTDPVGAWSKSALKPGAYILTVTDSSGSRLASEDIIIDGPVIKHWIQIGYVEIDGRVTLGGAPLAAKVAFGGISGRTSIKMDSDEEGRFEGLLPRAGAWPVDIKSLSADVFRRLRAVDVETRAGSSRASVVIELPGTRLEGEVVDPDGHGLTGVTVMAMPVRRKPGEPAEQPSYAQTDTGGLFSFEGFAAAMYRLQAARRVGEEKKKEMSSPVEVVLSEEDPFQSVRLVLGQPAVLRGRLLSAAGGVPGATIIARPQTATLGVYLPSAHSGPDGRFELSLPEDTLSAELTVMAAGFLFFRQVIAVDAQGEVPIQLEQQGGGTLVIRPDPQREPGRWYSHLTRSDGMRLDFGALSRWSTINQAPLAGETIEIPRMPSGHYSVCWPLSLGERLEGREQDCTEGYLSANSRLEIAQVRPESSNRESD